MNNEYISRKQYLEGEATHREYYAQFITKDLMNAIYDRLEKHQLDKMMAEDNPGAIDLVWWDSARHLIPSEAINDLRMVGDTPTTVARVCILKEAARQMMEAIRNKGGVNVN